MKMLIFIQLLFLVVLDSKGQNFTGKVEYKSILDFGKQNSELQNPEISLDKKKQIEQMKSSLIELEEHTYILNFNMHESSYRKEERLGIKDRLNAAANVLDFYKNFKDNIYIKEFDASGTIFHISERLPVFDWKLQNETQTIAGHICYKAIQSEIKESIKRVMSPTGGIEQSIIKDTITTVAWYCPDIPVSNGPDKFFGLPGLIMSIVKTSEFGGMPLTLYATQITLNPKEGVRVKRPKTKRLYSPAEFQLEMLKLSSGH